jgi:hypothetical protein
MTRWTPHDDLAQVDIVRARVGAPGAWHLGQPFDAHEHLLEHAPGCRGALGSDETGLLVEPCQGSIRPQDTVGHQ